MVGMDGKAGLSRRLTHDIWGRRRNSIHQIAAARAQGVIVAIHAAVKATGVVPKQKLQDDAVIGEGVQSVVHRGEGDPRQDRADPVVDVGGARMVVARPDSVENRLTLGRHPKYRAPCRTTDPLRVSRSLGPDRAHALASDSP